jgi:hypothetical protein
MSYTPGYNSIIPTMVSSYTPGIGPMTETVVGTPPGSGAWESADRAVYQVVSIPAPCTVKRVWWANGDTVTGGATVEVGIYRNVSSAPTSLVVSGSATQGAASEVQFVDVTDTFLVPGAYWLAITASTTTETTFFRSVVLYAIDASLRQQETAARPLPATATPVESSRPDILLFGFATTASP